MSMTLRRRLLDWSLAGLLLVLPALIFRSSLKSAPTGELSGFDQAVLRLSAPLQAATTWFVEGLGGMWSRYVALVDVESENRELRDDNQRLRKELAAASRRAFDIEAIEDLVELKKRTPADTVGARVIAASVSSFFRVLRIRIDRGQREVEPGMAVFTAEGLVGRVAAVYGGHADVMLITDPQSRVDVVVPRTGGRGILLGLGEGDRYRCRIKDVERPSEPNAADGTIKVGDEVVTSGLGAAFPGGMTVGKVSKVTTKDYGMFQEVEVEPAVELATLRAVMVLLAPPPPPDPDADKRKRSEPAFGVRAL
jgi:rod shape-determining protein MreC